MLEIINQLIILDTCYLCNKKTTTKCIKPNQYAECVCKENFHPYSSDSIITKEGCGSKNQT